MKYFFLLSICSLCMVNASIAQNNNLDKRIAVINVQNIGQQNVRTSENVISKLVKLNIDDIDCISEEVLVGSYLQFPDLSTNRSYYSLSYDCFIYAESCDTIWLKKRRIPKPKDYILVHNYKGEEQVYSYSYNANKTYRTPASSVSNKQFKIVGINSNSLLLEEDKTQRKFYWNIKPYFDNDLKHGLRILGVKVLNDKFLHKKYYIKESFNHYFHSTFSRHEKLECTEVGLVFGMESSINITLKSPSGRSFDVRYYYMTCFDDEFTYAQEMEEVNKKKRYEQSKLKYKHDRLQLRKNFDEKYGKSTTSDRKNVIYPTLQRGLPAIINAMRWYYDYSHGKWVGTKIDSPNSNGFYWMEWRSLTENKKQYKVLVWETNEGHFKYPAISAGWTSYRQRDYFILTSAEYDNMVVSLKKNIDTTVIIKSSMTGSFNNWIEPFSERKLMNDILDDIYLKYESLEEAERHVSCMTIKSILVNNKRYIRFVLPYDEYLLSQNDINIWYYEVSYATFMESITK